jgi:pyruvate/2-oxoglutarate dehydrogenase complex dihydrolipoamide dehydrogenase (E3) component
VAELQKILEADGIKFQLSAQTKQVENRSGEISLTLDTPQGRQAIAGSHLLVATGRQPNTADLDLAKAGIATNDRGYIKTNSRMETNIPGVWALGDIKGGPAFTHISYNDYQIVYANLIEGKNQTIEDRYLPYALFTDPQLGRVGITEGEARASGKKFKMGAFPMSSVSRSIEKSETLGFMKIIVDAATNRIVGAGILGDQGGELVQVLGLMMLANAPYTLMKGAVYIHPTMIEGFFGLMDSVKPVEP